MNLRRLNFGMDRFSGLYFWAALILLFGLWVPSSFLIFSTVQSVAAQQAITAMTGLAVLVPLLAGQFDLSVGATVNLTAVVVALLQTRSGWAMWPAIGVSVLVGVAVGGLNALIVVKLRVSSFIATLGMATILTAVVSIASGQSQPLPPNSLAWNNLAQVDIFGIQIVFYYLLVMAVILWWLLDHTPVGRYLSALGGNPEAARLSGVRSARWTAVSLVISATVSGVAGILYSSLNGPSLTFGPTLLLPAFAAAFLGSTQFRPGRFNVWGTVVAVYILGTGIYGMEIVTGVQWISDMFNGVALVTAVAFAVWRQSAAAKVKKKSLGVRPGGDDIASTEVVQEAAATNGAAARADELHSGAPADPKA
jgi:ribose transport system permease protein